MDVSSQQLWPSLFILHPYNTFQIPMAYFNDTNGRSVGSQPDYLVGSLTGFGTEESFGKHDLYSPLEDCGLTCASLQNQCLRCGTMVVTCCHIRNTTGPQLASMPSPTPPVSWTGTILLSVRWPRKFLQRPLPPPIVSTFLS